MRLRRGVYPGSFNPPTLAHIEIAFAARRHLGLDEVTLMMSTVTLAKELVSRPTLEHRLTVLQEVAVAHSWLKASVTDQQLLVDISSGYDGLVMGADKWQQIHDPVFYTDEEARDAAIAALPELAIAPRGNIEIPESARLDLPIELGSISSTAARSGARDQMCEAALRFDTKAGAWSDPDRYERYLASTHDF